MDESNEMKQLRLDFRHLAFFFLGAVVVCAIFFSLGFLVGRGQAYEASVKDPPSATKARELKSSNDLGAESNSAPEPSGYEDVSTSAGKSERKEAQIGDYRRELDFYSAVKGKNVDENFHPGVSRVDRLTPGQKKISKTQAVALGSRLARISPPGSLVSLQIAALRNGTDADKLVKSLRSKGYSVSIVTARATISGS